MVIAYIIFVLVGFFCIGFTIYEHKHLKQKDIDTELYNQSLQVTKEYLEQENKRLEEERALKVNSNINLLSENDSLQENQKILKNTVNELTYQKQKLETEVQNETIIRDNMRREQDYLTAQMGTLKRSIDETIRDQQALARQAFASWCEALDVEYQKKEVEYDQLLANLGHIFESEQDALAAEIRGNVEVFERRKLELQKDLDTIRSELDRIRATRSAAMEAQLREQEIKEKATFYTLQLNDADKRDVAYLQSIEYNLREARPLRMLIWSTFYRDRVNELAARVGAIGASGIYKITHIDSGISYIGQAKDLKERWVTHVKCSLGIDTPVTSQLYQFTREKGIDNFTFEVLEKCSVNELNEKEKFYIDLYQTYDFGLNKTRGNG